MAQQCTARSKRTGERCKRTAVVGRTVCRFHGAGGNQNERNLAAHLKHGRYSKYLHGTLAESYRAVLEAENPFDCTEVVTLSEATVVETVRSGDPTAIRRAVSEHVRTARDAVNTMGQMTPAEARVFVVTVMDVAYSVIERYVTDEQQRRTMFVALELGWRARLGQNGPDRSGAPEPEQPRSDATE